MANEDQAKFWTETAGPIWLEREEDLDVSARPFGLAAMDAADVKEGERVVDVGCGTGTTTIELARRVGADGQALGLDISPLLLGRAREKAGEEGIDNVDFVDGDAQTYELRDPVDLVYSRFGVMFFEDPVAAFRNLRSATTPGGRIAFACWQDVFTNAWMSVPTMAASSVLGGFDLPPEGAPGPFRYADTDRLRADLESGGYREIEIGELKTTLDRSAADPDKSLAFIVNMGPLGDKFKESDPETQRRTLDAVLEASAPYESDGTYRMPAGAWIVTAKGVSG